MIKIYRYGDVSDVEIFRGIIRKGRCRGRFGNIADVRKNGDFIFLMCEKFDGAKLSSLEVMKEERTGLSFS